jgi:hypothetical protein
MLGDRERAQPVQIVAAIAVELVDALTSAPLPMKRLPPTLFEPNVCSNVPMPAPPMVSSRRNWSAGFRC